MKYFLLTTAFLTLSFYPLPAGTTTGTAAPVQQAATVEPGAELVISTDGFDSGVYYLKLTKREDGSVTIERHVRTVINLDAEVLLSDAPPQTGGTPGESVSHIGRVAQNFGEDQELFNEQRKMMISALRLPLEGDVVDDLLHRIEERIYLTLGNYADPQWKPWTDWYVEGANKQPTVDDLKDWVSQAADSLELR